jgi:virulence factor Mce-like protein
VRRLGIVAIAVALVGFAAVAMGASGDAESGSKYRVVIDNAFGLTTGADVKVAGVRAGKVSKLDIQRGTNRALVTMEINKPGFGSFRSDVFCNIQPQSLIGEYFIDCNPGTAPRKLKPGSTIPVNQTASTIPADTVANILRLPYRQRLSLILSELGIALGARGEDLNQTIRRAVPALRETDRVLKILADERVQLAQLTHDSDTVLAALAANKTNVSRFVAEARDTAQISASRSTALAGTVHRLPTFLRQLRPTLRDLGTAAREQTPALRDLRAASPALTTFLQRLGPFANASRPAIRSLGQASVVGSRAVVSATPTIAELRRATVDMPELSKNLAIVLEDLDNRDHAVERDVRSPTGRGYTGLEALLQYPFTQSLALNIFDTRGYLLKLNALVNSCNSYTNAEHAKADPARTATCSGALGPNQPGVNTPDPSAGAASVSKQSKQATVVRAIPAIAAAAAEQAAPAGAAAPATPATATATAADGKRSAAPAASVGEALDAILGRVAGPAATPGSGSTASQAQTSSQLLNFLLAP